MPLEKLEVRFVETPYLSGLSTILEWYQYRNKVISIVALTPYLKVYF